MLAGLFLLLLSSGNLVLGPSWTRCAIPCGTGSWKFEISFGRIFFWGFMATVALALVLPLHSGKSRPLVVGHGLHLGIACEMKRTAGFAASLR